jgi:16S rRNA (cytosine1402-N4)-methyltransferase
VIRRVQDSTRPATNAHSPRHVPVMLREVIAALEPKDGATYVDGTFGGGGYSRALLESAECTVYGIDRDPAAIEAGQELRAAFPTRLNLIEGRFGEMDRLLSAHGVKKVQGIAFDLGVSSRQLDEPKRGFSFRLDGPLDMRMGSEGMTAADAVNSLDEDELASIIRDFGEERFARRIARAIVTARSEHPIERTLQLAEIVRSAVRSGHDGIDPATRTFQALRIYVNGEIEEISRGLEAAERILKLGGRLAVVSFHSLEDRPVKQFLAARSGAAAKPSRHSPAHVAMSSGPAPTFRLLSRRALRPSEDETAANPRARSARLRSAERTAAPAHGPKVSP